MAADDLLARTLAIIEEVTGPGRTPPDASSGTPLADGFWLDSVELLEVLVACESEFGVLFDDRNDLQAGVFDTLGTLTDLIRNKRSAGQHES
jgi:acyl carrier protein